MPKRRVVREVSAADSELSPPPLGLLEPQESVAGAKSDIEQEPARPSKRRKIGVAPSAAKTTSSRVRGKVSEQDSKGPIREAPNDKGGEDGLPATKASPKVQRKRKAAVKSEDAKDADEDTRLPTKAKQKRKSKAEKEAELVTMPLAARTIAHRLYIGAHVSASGGVQNAISNSVHIGANAFAFFLKSQRKWANPPLTDEHQGAFHTNCDHHSYDQAKHVVPHGSYLVNLAHTDPTRTKQAYDSFVDDLHRCDRLGVRLYNFHPGNDQCGDRPKAIAHLAANINRAHAETESVITLLENMAAGGNVLGSTFEDLRDVIALTENKERVGVCLDTCHAFAAGYDLRTPAAYQDTMQRFDDVVGVRYLKALHINDSKAPFDSKRDLHANIGTGFLGLRSFHNLVNDSRMEGLPLILETPVEVRDETGELVKDEKGKEKEDKGIWAREIKMLESLVGMDADSAEFVEMEIRLSRQGEPERKRLMEQFERKKDKGAKKGAKKAKADFFKPKSKAKKTVAEESELSELDTEGST